MLFQPPMYQQNKGEGICFYPIISIYIYLYPLYLLFIIVFYLFVFIYKYMAYSRHWGRKVYTLFGKKGILLAHSPEADAIFNHF